MRPGDAFDGQFLASLTMPPAQFLNRGVIYAVVEANGPFAAADFDLSVVAGEVEFREEDFCRRVLFSRGVAFECHGESYGP